MSPTPDNITKLGPNEIFVFGSNYAGRHGAGAALVARKKFGAINGITAGLMGQSYGIPTKDAALRTLPLDVIAIHIESFLWFAHEHPEKTFLVTPIGCGLAGYEPRQIAPLFFAHPIPPNVRLPQSFYSWRRHT